ncbi:MAG: type II toxin-antitoxin system MqsA family antitoxin [Magnetococcales bacterium]|nr:type II toxin-antitoxin system MqsA family antitoxin [Magnetococcales bacterium]
MCTEDKKCAVCGGSLIHEERDRTCRYTKKTRNKHEVYSVQYHQPGLWCTTCGEGYIKGDDQKVHNAVFTTLRSKVEGVLSPTEIQCIRENLGLSKRKASLLIGGGHNAFQKYETGEVMPSKSTSSLIRLLGARPELISVLTSLQQPQQDKHIHLPNHQGDVKIQTVSA